MSYQEKVQRKLEASGQRQNERVNTWDEIVSAYEAGASEQVEAEIAKLLDGISAEFRTTIAELRKRL